MDKHVLETTKYYHPLYYCSFCHKEYVEKEPMILGPDVSMCYECLEIAAKEISCPWTTEPPRKEGEYNMMIKIKVYHTGRYFYASYCGLDAPLDDFTGAQFQGPLRPER